MRNIIIFFVGIVVHTAALCQPKISFETINHDFGLIKDEPLNLIHAFNYVNTGDSVLVITDVKYNCKCTALGWDAPLHPGDTSKIYVSVSPKRNLVAFNERFEVVSNAINEEVVFYLQGLNTSSLEKSSFYKHKMGAFAMESQYISFGNIIKSKRPMKEVTWFNESNDTVRIDSLTLESPDYLAITFDTYKIAPHRQGRMVVQLISDSCDRVGYGVDNVRFITNEKGDDYIKEFFVVSTLFPNLPKTEPTASGIIEPSLVNLGTLEEGERGVAGVMITNVGAAPLKILKVDTNCDCVRLSQLPSSLAQGASVAFDVYFDTSGRVGKQYKRISIFTNDPINPVLTIDLKAHLHD